MPRSNVVNNTFVLGDRVKWLSTRTSTDDEVNRLFIRGSNGLKATLTSSAFQSGFQKERVIFLPALEDAAEAAIFGTAYFDKFGVAQPSGAIRLAAWEEQLESVGPALGKVRVIGGVGFVKQGARLSAQLPMALSGTVGAAYEQIFRLDQIAYSPYEGGLRVEIALGERRSAWTDILKALELKLSDLTQKISRGTGTGEINPNALTTLGSFASITEVAFTAETQVAAIIIAAIGRPAHVTGGLTHVTDDTGAGGASTTAYQCKRDGVVIERKAGIVTAGQIRFDVIDTPPAGTVLYEITGVRTAGPSTPSARERSLIIVEHKTSL